MSRKKTSLNTSRFISFRIKRGGETIFKFSAAHLERIFLKEKRIILWQDQQLQSREKKVY